MTVHRLSAQSVKVQLSADELKLFLPDSTPNPDSPQMLRLISFMLTRAEASSGIPFSSLPVTVEMLAAPEGGLTVYFTAQTLPDTASGNGHSKTTRLAARFPDESALHTCCTQLHRQQSEILNSALYRYRTSWILTLKAKRRSASRLHHLLLEYGTPFRLSSINRARLSEYGECLYEKDAVTCMCERA